MQKVINYILTSSCYGLMVIYVTTRDFSMYAGKTLGNWWWQLKRLFNYEEWMVIVFSLSISLLLCTAFLLFSLWYERKYGMAANTAISQFIKRIFKWKRRSGAV